MHECSQTCTVSGLQAKQVGHWGVRKKKNGMRKTFGGWGEKSKGQGERGPSVVSVTAGRYKNSGEGGG